MPLLKSLKHTIISFKLAKKVFIALIFVLIFDFFLFPAPVLASEDLNTNEPPLIINLYDSQSFNSTLPENSQLNIVKTGYYEITAYNSDPAQCDSTPCITANGFNVCEHGLEDTIASNAFKFGTRIKIPELYGDKVFIVRDKMNSRYYNRLDIWMTEKADALNFGIKYAKIEILAGP